MMRQKPLLNHVFNAKQAQQRDSSYTQPTYAAAVKKQRLHRNGHRMHHGSKDYMTSLNFVTEITVHGTKKSERAGGLDNHEISSFSIKPGEYSRDLEDLEDLLSMINEGAYKRGEWISSIAVNGKNIIKDIISDILMDCRGNEDDAITELSNLGMFMHADGDWLRSEVMLAKKDMHK